MIPLVRPLFPSSEAIEHYFKQSRNLSVYSNFGPCHEMLVARLKEKLKTNALPVVSGTAALQVAVATHFKRGSKIAVPDFTHIGTLQAVTQAGCEPVLFPVSRHTWTLDVNSLREHADKVDGVIVVSPFGYQVEVPIYDDICKQEKKILIYDFAGSWGNHPDTKNTVCYSFHATKNFSCGEGGLVCFSKRPDFQEARRLINFDTLGDRTIGSEWGFNFKIDELKCAVILAQLDQDHLVLKRIFHKKAAIDIYQKELREICISHDLHKEGAPSLAVLAGMKCYEIERGSSLYRFVCKPYYPLLSHMAALVDIPRVGTSAPYFQTCLALPSDVTPDEAVEISKSIKRILKTL
jgi:dTDP-4-amino-4,6-dideoxygalactose transaminase